MYRIIVIIAVLAASFAQILLKAGASKGYSPFWRKYVNMWVICGYFVLAGSLMLNVFCMGHGVQAKEVSIIESLSYLFIPCLSYFFFHESITWKRTGALALILTGVFVFFI